MKYVERIFLITPEQDKHLRMQAALENKSRTGTTSAYNAQANITIGGWISLLFLFPRFRYRPGNRRLADGLVPAAGDRELKHSTVLRIPAFSLI
jgi:hypothetical protein